MHTTTQTAALAAPPFRYAVVDAEHREWLRQTTETIRTALKRTAANLVQVGRLLADAKVRLPRGQWEEWAAAEMPWSLAQTRRLMAVGRTFGDTSAAAQIERFGSSALYVFTSPDTPRAAREYAMELAADGQRITHSLAKEIVDAHRRNPEVSGKEQKGYERESKKLDATRDEEQATPAAETHRMIGDAVSQLTSQFDTIHVTKITDDESEERPLYSVTVISREGDKPFLCRQGYSLADVLLVLAGRPRKKECPGCARKREVTKFAVNATCPDGWNRRCKECETKRLRKHKAKKKAKAAETVAAKTAGGPTAPVRRRPASDPAGIVN